MQDVCIGHSTLGAAIDISGRLWTWGSNIAGELGIGDNEPKINPYPVLALKKKTVTQIACGSSFVVALGSNLKKELPGLRLNLKKVTSLSRRGNNHHKRNADDIMSNASGYKRSAQSQDRKSSGTRSNKKKRPRSFQRVAKSKDHVS